MATASATVITDEMHRALSKAKIQLMARPDSAFFTTILFSLKHVWEERISTAATEGKHIFLNPKFFMGLDEQERIFLLLHEAMHVAYMHMIRQGTRDGERFNIAGDHVINLQLVERGFKCPKIGLLDRQYAGMNTEQVYELLPPNPPKGGMGGDIMYGDPDTSGQLTQDIQDIVVRASIQSKMAGDKPGTIPGDIQIFLDGLLNPKLPWNRILQKFLNAFAKDDYSYRKPNRRFFPKYHMPSLHGERLMDLTVAVDTSGSVSDADFKVFVTEVASILRMMKPDKITLLQFDTAIKSVDEIKSVKELTQCKFTGRGGTIIHPVIEWANKSPTQLLLVFSDGEFHMPTTPTKAQTLWIIHNNQRFAPPFGKVVHYSI